MRDRIEGVRAPPSQSSFRHVGLASLAGTSGSSKSWKQVLQRHLADFVDRALNVWPLHLGQWKYTLTISAYSIELIFEASNRTNLFHRTTKSPALSNLWRGTVESYE